MGTDSSKLPKVPKKQTPGRVSSDELFKHGKELVIEHDSQEYRLRITGNGKLILTK